MERRPIRWTDVSRSGRRYKVLPVHQRRAGNLLDQFAAPAMSQSRRRSHDAILGLPYWQALMVLGVIILAGLVAWAMS